MYFFYVFNVFFQNPQKHDFLRFFWVVAHVFPNSALNTEGPLRSFYLRNNIASCSTILFKYILLLFTVKRALAIWLQQYYILTGLGKMLLL